MKFPIAVLPVALCALLLSPSAQAVHAETVEGVKASGIVFQPLKGAGKVAVRTKGQRMAAFGIGMVVGNAMGSSADNLHDAMEIAQISNDLTQFSFQEFGYQRVGQQGPAAMVQAALQSWAQSAGVPAATDAKTAYVVALGQNLWSLQYEGMFKDDYVLSYAMTATLKAPGARRATARGTCQGQFDQKRPLEQWQADDHAAVAEAARQIGRRCAVEIAHMLGFADAETITALIEQGEEKALLADAASVPADATDAAAVDTEHGTPAEAAPAAGALQ